MRRMIGRNGVDRAVDDPLDHRVAIRGLAQRRVHLGVGVVGNRRRQRLVREREVVRRHLAGNPDAAVLRLAHRAQRRAGAHVRDVEVGARQLGEQHAALDAERFARTRHAAQAE